MYEDWKPNIAVLWIVSECGAIVTSMLELYQPSSIEEIIAGEVGGVNYHPN